MIPGSDPGMGKLSKNTVEVNKVAGIAQRCIRASHISALGLLFSVPILGSTKRHYLVSGPWQSVEPIYI